MFYLWVKCKLSWIVQITWICDIHLCITTQSNAQNIIQCSISNSLWYKEGNLCLTFLANDNENAWHLIEFILPQYISTHVILQTNMAGRIPCWMKSHNFLRKTVFNPIIKYCDRMVKCIFFLFLVDFGLHGICSKELKGLIYIL
jgi:hypothetical protein